MNPNDSNSVIHSGPYTKYLLILDMTLHVASNVQKLVESTYLLARIQDQTRSKKIDLLATYIPYTTYMMIYDMIASKHVKIFCFKINCILYAKSI